MRLRRLVTILALAALGIAVVPQAQAQRQSYQSSSSQQGNGRNQPGDFDYYALVLSWSPSFCAGEGSGRGDPQCASSRPYAFVLHGLWPQYTRGFPENCRTTFNPFVPRPVINGMLDIMPSPNLAIHEYRTHGTCSGLEPRPYFDTARKFYNKIKIPAIYTNLDRPLTTNVGDITKAFLAANPGLKPEMMGVACKRPNRMQEIRFCFSTDGEFKTCGSNENQGRLCRSPSIYMPPVRGGGKRGWLPGRSPAPDAPVPADAPEGARKI